MLTMPDLAHRDGACLLSNEQKNQQGFSSTLFFVAGRIVDRSVIRMIKIPINGESLGRRIPVTLVLPASTYYVYIICCSLDQALASFILLCTFTQIPDGVFDYAEFNGCGPLHKKNYPRSNRVWFERQENIGDYLIFKDSL
uniref:Uncharacterized protein n=1 Tax=Romanomermis culicivorax TaxID=13658 RepID=A0A915HV51_ROMCU